MNGFRSLLAGNFVGKVFGVFREILLAALFGTGPAAAAYRIAQTATLTPINFFTSDALSAGFLPEHSKRLARNREAAAQYYRAVSRILIGISLLLLFALCAFRDAWVMLLGPGLDQGVIRLASSMLLVMAVGVPFYISTGLGSYLEMSHGSFYLASVRPTVQSIGLIAGTIAGYALDQPTLLAVGFTASYVLLAIGTRLRLAQLNALAVASSDRHAVWHDLNIFWLRLRPMLLAPLLLQGSWAVERAVASLIGLDAVAAIDYSRLVTDTVVVTIAAPLGLSLLVSLSTLTDEASHQKIGAVIQIFLAIFIPVSAILSVCAKPLVTLLFERGRFDSDSSLVTGQILTGLAIGMFAQGLAAVLIKALNARHRNGAAAAAIAAGCASMILFDILAFEHFGALALGLGASLGGAVQVLVACRLLESGRVVWRELVMNTPHFILAAIALFVIHAQKYNDFTIWLTACCVAGGSLLWIAVVPHLRTSILNAARGLGR